MKTNRFDENFERIIEGLKGFDEVDAVALGGSRATGADDKKSDYDVYVYCESELAPEKRGKVIAPLCGEAEIGNHYWESEDNCVMKNGVPIDIIYRSLSDFERFSDMLLDGGFAMNGYSTCFWQNILTCEVLFDKSGRFSELKAKSAVPYPQALKRNIIEKNRNLLSGKLPSYDMQIKKAEDRGDLVSVHHRTTELLASYFDIIFALNEVPHPGEKRLVSLCREKCRLLPDNFEENINALLKAVTNGGAYNAAVRIVAELDKILS